MLRKQAGAHVPPFYYICKYDWWYSHVSYDQYQVLEFKEYRCRKCGKIIRGK